MNIIVLRIGTEFEAFVAKAVPSQFALTGDLNKSEVLDPLEAGEVARRLAWSGNGTFPEDFQIYVATIDEITWESFGDLKEVDMKEKPAKADVDEAIAMYAETDLYEATKLAHVKNERIVVDGIATPVRKVTAFVALYNRSMVRGMGVIAAIHAPREMTEDIAAQYLLETRSRQYFDYVHGRPMKLNFKDDVLDLRLYDRDNGKGAGRQAIALLPIRMPHEEKRTR